MQDSHQVGTTLDPREVVRAHHHHGPRRSCLVEEDVSRRGRERVEPVGELVDQ